MLKKTLIFIGCTILGEIGLIGIDLARYYVGINHVEGVKAKMRSNLVEKQKHNPCIITDDPDDPARKLPDCAELVRP
jgi:hypothetical protein